MDVGNNHLVNPFNVAFVTIRQDTLQYRFTNTHEVTIPNPDRNVQLAAQRLQRDFENEGLFFKFIDFGQAAMLFNPDKIVYIQKLDNTTLEVSFELFSTTLADLTPSATFLYNYFRTVFKEQGNPPN